MIISHIIGGLGNQMFQYATGRALSQLKDRPFKVDVSDFSGYGLHHGFELQRVFDCQTLIATTSDVRSILRWHSIPLIRRLVARPCMKAFHRSSLVVEPHFHHWPGINSVPSDCYLQGYWQSEKYFQTATQIIRADFTFTSPLKKHNAELAAQIRQVNAVSLHVRRGDYATDPKTKATLGLCSLNYYQAAIEYISDRIDHPFFFVFSDDIDWTVRNLKIRLPCHYVDHNHGADSYNDMHLMSLCKHHIIANSSFSWWGAWLNANQEKIVVAPKRWFENDNNVEDLLPSGWVRL